MNSPKGKRLFEAKKVDLKSIDWMKARCLYYIKSDRGPHVFFSVRINSFDKREINSTCNCGENDTFLCAHVVASLYALKNEVSNLVPAEVVETLHVLPPSEVGLLDTVYHLPLLNTSGFLKYLSWTDFNMAQEIYKANGIEPHNIADNKASFNCNDSNGTHQVLIKKLDADKVMIECSCVDDKRPMCLHKAAVLYYIAIQYGERGLQSLKNWDSEKQILLANYGYSLGDNISQKFDFAFDNGNLRLIVLDKSLQQIPGTAAFDLWMEHFASTNYSAEKLDTIKKGIGADELLFVITKTPTGYFPETGIQLLIGKRKKTTEFYKSFELFDTYRNRNSFIRQYPQPFIAACEALQSRLFTAVYMPDFAGKNAAPLHELNKDKVSGLQHKMNTLLQNVFENAASTTFYVGQLAENNSVADIDFTTTYTLSATPLHTSIHVLFDKNYMTLQLRLVHENSVFHLSDFEVITPWLLKKEDVVYKLNSIADFNLLQKFESQHELKFRLKDKQVLFTEIIQPLAKTNQVSFENTVVIPFQTQPPQVHLYLKEFEKVLLFIPKFIYSVNVQTAEADLFTANDLLVYHNDDVYTVKRHTETETTLTQFFQSLHPDFAYNHNEPYFYLSIEQVMHQGWFFTLFEKLKQKNIAVFGQQELKKIRYNTHKPTLVFGNSSGTDWLDLQLTVTFGNTQASLTDVRKAILNNQKFIPLNDGTIGLLPDDWVTRYAALFKFGKLDKSKVSISKLHISIIDSYLNEINNETLALELHHKKSRLTQFQSIQNQNVPKHINAQLRPYQVSGFEWLQFLNDFNWGGCLADDMGLGKTLQVLTLLQHLKNKQALKTSLVVVPTTLIFNWNNEVEKYCPQLTIYTHHGAQRQWPELWQQYDIILTTYGTLRSDLSTIKNMAFDYVILDESQAIKNPLSQISKAVRVLIAKNRLVMTGTPIENNTFDLYAQMEFLNPGFLGNSDFFRNEFATPIDKYGIEEKAASLRKLIAPFVLKRTKEEVADDLPPKTETVLYCEMGIEQRKLYDSYKEKYRQQILQKIDAEGVAKSGFLILEGLLKLRMICDATAMVADNQREKNYSTKLDELMREITENAGHHKIVVFSQFLKMLDIIKQQLILANIPFEYLDGQTTDRKDRIENFQQNENIRVFLMSLKAGGVGINLTEADYVYLVDPWWNPAVEQQAIDRTHRIGQKRNVFAYKMICKDTVEEKIMQLQGRKKILAGNLIDTEKNLLKKLDKDEIAALFS